MPRYTRAYIPGGTFFFTVALLERDRRLLVEHIELLRNSFRQVRKIRPFGMDAIVVLPDHLHCIWSLPAEDADFSTRWRRIKGLFTQGIPLGERVSARRQIKAERGIWQRRFWEHAIRDEIDFERHLDYIHYNPIKHQLASCAHGWPYSSFAKWVQRNVYETSWQCSCNGEVVKPPDFRAMSELQME